MKTYIHKRYRRFTFLLLLVVMGAFTLNGCSASKESTVMSPARSNAEAANAKNTLPVSSNNKNYVIEPGDQVIVTVWNNSQFNVNQVVPSDGTIAYPLIGEVRAEGLSKEQFTNLLKSKLANYINGGVNMTVTISRQNQKEVSVFGSVNRPDNYPMDKTTSILRVLADAGGPSATADLRHIQVIRPGQSPDKISLDIDSYFKTNLKQAMPDSPYQIKPGDIIYVPKADNVVRDLSGFMRDAVILFGVFKLL